MSLSPEAKKITLRVEVLIDEEFPDVKPKDLRDAFKDMFTTAQEMVDEEAE